MAKSYTAEEIAAAGLLALQKRDADDADTEAANKAAAEAKRLLDAKRKREDEDDDSEIEELKVQGKEALRKERRLRREAERRAEDAEAEAKAAKDALATSTKKQAEAEGNYEALYKAEKKKNDELAEAQKAEAAKALRTKIAGEYKLPADLADRLVGKDEAELKADAEKLAKQVKPSDAPNLETNTGNTNEGKGQRDASQPKTNFSFMPANGVPIPE